MSGRVFTGGNKLNVSKYQEYSLNVTLILRNKVPTRSSAFQSLLAREHTSRTSSVQTQFSSAIFVNDALKLKLRQYVTPVHSALFYANLYRLRLRHDKSSIIRELDEHDLERINAERRLLYCDIVAWRTRRAQHMPHVVLAVSDVQPDEDQEPEDICLFVPSDFTEPERQLYHLEEIARVELDLRMGEANDTIKELCMQINFKLGLQSEKKH